VKPAEVSKSLSTKANTRRDPSFLLRLNGCAPLIHQ
jgi:hypothetical protein